MPRPVISALRRWWSPEKDEPTPPTPEPTPTPDPAPAPQPEPAPVIPTVKPGMLTPVNYLRALMLLRKIPIKKLREEFLKLPLRQIGFILGFIFWLFMSYVIICFAVRWLTLK